MEIKYVATQRVLSPTQINLADYTINPYRGCEFGCLYCYSQENKNLKQGKFFKTLSVKHNALDILEKELKYKNPKRVLLGSTTECFQYQELKFKITNNILKILNKNEIPYTILTKSHLIKHSLGLISKNKENKVYFTLNFHCDSIIRIFEPNSSSTEERLNAICELINKGIKVRAHIGPFIPLVSEISEIFKLIPKKIEEVVIFPRKSGHLEERMVA